MNGVNETSYYFLVNRRIKRDKLLFLSDRRIKRDKLLFLSKS